MSDSSAPFSHPWPERLLGDIGNVIVGGTPSTSVEKYWDGDVPWMASGDVYLGRITDVPTRITQLGLRHSNATLVPPPTVAVALAGQGKTRGTVALVLCTLCTNQSVALLAARSDCLDTTYLFHNLAFRYEELRSRSAGGGRAGLSKQLLEQVPVPLPPKAEQIKIAEILSTVDQAIEQTEGLIAKQQRIKTGLMQDLLTRGIERGKLRSEQTHEFKDSPLGRIPVEWNALSIHELATHVGSGVTPRGGDNVYTKEGVLFIRSQNVHFGGLRLDDVAYLPQHVHASMRRSEVFANDVLLNITGASIGRCCQMPAFEGQANVNQHVCAIRLRQPTDADAGLLSSILESSIGQNQIAQFNAGGNREGLNYQQVRSFLIPWPKEKSERDTSYKLIRESENALTAFRKAARKLRFIRVALMQDLLTGDRRVTALFPQPEVASV